MQPSVLHAFFSTIKPLLMDRDFLHAFSLKLSKFLLIRDEHVRRAAAAHLVDYMDVLDAGFVLRRCFTSSDTIVKRSLYASLATRVNQLSMDVIRMLEAQLLKCTEREEWFPGTHHADKNESVDQLLRCIGRLHVMRSKDLEQQTKDRWCYVIERLYQAKLAHLTIQEPTVAKDIIVGIMDSCICLQDGVRDITALFHAYCALEEKQADTKQFTHTSPGLSLHAVSRCCKFMGSSDDWQGLKRDKRFIHLLLKSLQVAPINQEECATTDVYAIAVFFRAESAQLSTGKFIKEKKSLYSEYLAAYLLLIQRLVADKQLFVQLMDSNRIQQHCDVFKAMLARTIANGVFQRHASLLISIVHLLSMHLTNHYGIDGWLLGLFKLQLDDNTSIKRVFECARSTTAMSTFTTTTRLMLQRIRHMLGHIDGEEETRAEGEHEQYLVATLKYNKLILESILGYLTKAVTDVEWYMASLPMNDPCLRCLSNALDMLLIISSSVVERATGDHLLRLCTRIYKNVSSISQKLEASNDLVPAVYDTVVKYACLLSRNLYTLVPILQAAESEQMADVPKKKKLKPNVVRVRKSNDGKLMPNLIFYIEQFERYVIMVSKKKRLPFAKHIKRSTARDFRITFDALEEEVEEEEVEV